MCDFIKQVIVNFLGTVFGGVLLYFLLEKRFIDAKNTDYTKKLLKNLLGETIRNIIVAERIIKDDKKILSTAQFPIARFKTNATEIFTYERPIPKHRKFYLDLSGIVSNMEGINSLIGLVFSNNGEKSIITNKKEILSLAPRLLGKLNEVLLKLVEFNNIYKFNDENEE